MNFNELVKGSFLTQKILFEAMIIFKNIKNQIITVNDYYNSLVYENDVLKKQIKEENKALSTNDKVILSLFLSSIKDNVVDDQNLNSTSITYEVMLDYFNIYDEEVHNLSNKEYASIYNRYFVKTITMILFSKGNINVLKYEDENFYKYIYECLYEEHIVNTNIIENIISEMGLYDDYISSFSVDSKEEDIRDYERIKKLYYEEKNNDPEFDREKAFLKVLRDVLSERNYSNDKNNDVCKIIDINSKAKKKD